MDGLLAVVIARDEYSGATDLREALLWALRELERLLAAKGAPRAD